MRRRTLAAALPALLAACGASTVLPPTAPDASTAAAAAIALPPDAPREMRGAWVATVANIDWPSKPGLSAQAQRAEAAALLDRARAIGINALFFQVRPAGDALYASALEPWSEVLSGTQGRAPWHAGEPAWDPLAFWVDEAHRRGIELHAWFNPYRARTASARSPLVAPHIGVRQPVLIKRYADMLWIDPGEPAAAAHTLAVVADVLRRYDIDGVHIDDYFYPYPVPLPGAAAAPAGAASAPEQPFPDDASWARFQLGGGLLSRDDWRRSNVDTLVQALYRTAHAIKPSVRVSISPFGIGRPDRRPPGINGFSQYDKLYADVERWLAEGWLDALVPQLYWPIDREGQQFAPLLDGWLAENRAARHVWAGLFTSQVTRGEALGPRAWPAREVVDQIALQRSRTASSGHVHFSMAALLQDRDGIATLLQFGPYAQAALVPATPWLVADPVGTPRLRRSAGSAGSVAIDPAPGAAAQRWAVWRRVGGQWLFSVQPPQQRTVDASGADAVAVGAIDRVGNVGERAVLMLR